ncbi:MAG TPA: hypothetical protein V6D29_10590 [Leptolyngbyaceae cyanobacterium]
MRSHIFYSREQVSCQAPLQIRSVPHKNSVSALDIPANKVMIQLEPGDVLRYLQRHRLPTQSKG